MIKRWTSKNSCKLCISYFLKPAHTLTSHKQQTIKWLLTKFCSELLSSAHISRDKKISNVGFHAAKFHSFNCGWQLFPTLSLPYYLPFYYPTFISRTAEQWHLPGRLILSPGGVSHMNLQPGSRAKPQLPSHQKSKIVSFLSEKYAPLNENAFKWVVKWCMQVNEWTDQNVESWCYLLNAGDLADLRFTS